MAQLTEEVGEVARIIAVATETIGKGDKNKDLGEELVDVVL